MLGPYWIPSRETLVSSTKREIAHAAMRSNYDIVVDNMNLNPKEVKYWEDIVNNYNKYLNSEGVKPDWLQYEYEIEFKDFFIPLEECIRRDAMRSNPIGEKVIRDTWKRYKHFIQTSEVERYVNNLKRYEGKPKCIVIDMDSTVCFNMSKRPWYGEGAADEHGSFLHEIIADDVEQAYQMAYEIYPDFEIECIDIIGDETY